MTPAAWIVIGLFLVERLLTTVQIWLVRRDPHYSTRQERERERASSLPPPPPPPRARLVAQEFLATAEYPQPSRFVRYGGSDSISVAGWRCRICGSGPLRGPGICPICQDTEPWRKRDRRDTEQIVK